MSTLLSLPPELRQRILTFALPPTLSHSKPWARPLASLLHISHLLRADMAELLNTWSPLHYLSYPASLRSLASPTFSINTSARSPKIERICLDVFHDAFADRMRWTCYCQGMERYSHPELVAAWAAAVPQLPTQGISAVYLDVTPAPAAKRLRHPLVLNAFVSDKRCASTFLGCHIHDVADLIHSLDVHFNRKVDIFLIGTLSRKSEVFVIAVQITAGRDVPFVGTWVERDQARFASVAHAVDRFAPEREMRSAEKSGVTYPFRKLRGTAWSQGTTWTWASVAHGGEEDAATEDLKKIALFEACGQEEMLEMQAVGSVRRALQHRIVEDLGLKSGSVGEGEERRVVVRRE